jgi:hypothetical protein
MITQQLQRTRLQTRLSSESPEAMATLHPGIARVASGSSVGSSGPQAGRLDRAVSSSSIGRNDRIDEEQEEHEQGFFTFEDEDEMGRKKQDGSSTTSSPAGATANKRFSGGWGGFHGLGSGASGAPNTKLQPLNGLGAIGGQRTASGSLTKETSTSPWNSSGV